MAGATQEIIFLALLGSVFLFRMMPVSASLPDSAGALFRCPDLVVRLGNGSANDPIRLARMVKKVGQLATKASKQDPIQLAWMVNQVVQLAQARDVAKQPPSPSRQAGWGRICFRCPL